MSTIQVRRGTAAQGTANNPVLAAGEIGFETDTGKFKIGDGITAWTSLAYSTSSVTKAAVIATGLAPADISAATTAALATETTARSAGDALAPLKTNNGSDFADAGSTRLNLHVAALAVCQVAATSNVALSGLQTIDGYTTLAGDLVLCVGQTSAAQNGPWLAASGAWTRPHEYGTTLSIAGGRTARVVNGTVNALTDWTLTTPGTVTVDTTATTWTKLPGGGAQIAGDLGGTLSNPLVVTVNGGQTPVNLASFLGFSQVVRPSGDATGATDLANINAALAGGTNTSYYLNGNYTINGSIVVPSNVTLILADAYIQLAAAINKPIIVNPSYDSSTTPAASNVHIRGIGRALLDYNGANQTEQMAALYNSCSICLVNVSNFSIQDIQFQNAQYVHVMMQVCSGGRVRNSYCTHGATDKGYMHADFGCSNITIDGVASSGTWADSVFSMNTLDGALAARTPYAATLNAAGQSVSQITIRNVTLASSTGMISIATAGSQTVTDIDIENIHNTYTGATVGNEIDLGPAGYQGATLPVHGAVSGLRVKGYTFGGTNQAFFAMGTDCTDLHVSGVRANGSVLGLLGDPVALPGSYYPQLTRITFSDINLPAIGGSGSALSAIPAGYNVTDLVFENVVIGVANAPILKNVSDVTGLKLDGIHVGVLGANPFQSTGNEIGVVQNFTYDSKNTGVTAILPSIPTWRIAQPFPELASADATPLPVRGSEINCAPGKDPTGGAATAGGRYLADGSGWNLVSSFNTKFRPGQVYHPLLFHYDAASILGLSNGAAVAKWPDSANNNALLQATGGAQPTWAASDATLNGHPSVVFNGTSQWMQTGLLTPMATPQPFSLFIVYYLTATTAGAHIMEAATTATGSDGPLYELKTTTNTGAFLGTTTVQNASAVTTNAALIGCMVAGAAGNQVNFGENKAAFASMTLGSSGSKTITGFTLAANWNGASTFGPVTVAECFGYQGLVSTAEYATIMAALAAKYNVTLV